MKDYRWGVQEPGRVIEGWGKKRARGGTEPYYLRTSYTNDRS